WNALVAAAVLSIALNPTVYALTRKLFGGASKLVTNGDRVEVDPKRCVLVGYGPVGRSVDARLRTMDIAVTVVELNLDTVRALKAEGQPAVYGDALKRVTLEEANLASAGMLVISTEIEDAAELVPSTWLEPGASYVRALFACCRSRSLARCGRGGHRGG